MTMAIQSFLQYYQVILKRRLQNYLIILKKYLFGTIYSIVEVQYPSIQFSYVSELQYEKLVCILLSDTLMEDICEHDMELWPVLWHTRLLTKWEVENYVSVFLNFWNKRFRISWRKSEISDFQYFSIANTLYVIDFTYSYHRGKLIIFVFRIFVLIILAKLWMMMLIWRQCPWH